MNRGRTISKKYYDTIPEEQETIINIDYGNSEVNCYCSRKLQMERLMEKLGEPTKIFYVKKKITGASWVIPFKDKKRISTLLSRPVLIGQLK